MGIHKGTKLTDKPKDRVIRARIDKDMSEKLDAVIKEKHLSISEIVRDGIEMHYADIKK